MFSFTQSVWLYWETDSGSDSKENSLCCSAWILVSFFKRPLTNNSVIARYTRSTPTENISLHSELLSNLQASVEKVARIKYALDQDTEEWHSEPNSPKSPDSVKSVSRQNSRRSRTSSVSSVDTAILEERVSGNFYEMRNETIIFFFSNFCSNYVIKFNYARDAELVNTIRKELAMTLKEVMQHGLVRVRRNIRNIRFRTQSIVIG